MLSDEIRRRLTRLHAAPRSAAVHPALSPARWVQPAPTVAEPAFRDSDWLANSQVCQNASGVHQRFRRSIGELWPKANQVITGVVGRRVDKAGRHAELAAVAQWFPRSTLFLDLETCGFAGSMAFLVGLVWNDGGLVVDQLLARTYAEERAVLATLWQIAAENRVLVTFNGKSFDWPMVHDRSTRYHLGRDMRGLNARRPATARPAEGLGRDDARPELVHCDLLHHARRRWKGLLPNCRLQTLERTICGRVRHDDLPGSLVPAAYHAFVRTGRTHELGAILRHNALDLVTLAQLVCRMLADDATPGVVVAKSA
jgi:uncharacterized protein YprB with RNaseH-like and TPR domain